MTREIYALEEAFSTKQRKQLAKRGRALPDGSFPITDATSLSSAVKLAGKARNPKRARAFIKKRAAQLGLSKQIPATKKWSKATWMRGLPTGTTGQ